LIMFRVHNQHNNTFRVERSTPRVDTICVESDTMKTTGERIKQAREALGWSAQVLATKVGYKTQSGISNLENRATGSGGNKVGLIATVLGVPLDWLINGPDRGDVPFLRQQALPASYVAHEPVVEYLPQREDPLKVERFRERSSPSAIRRRFCFGR
jgi:transcriptional regulator with XRE-family HTH domain